ncbi:MAG: hypothetical protein WKG06_30365 [Segetibacter sp.]
MAAWAEKLLPKQVAHRMANCWRVWGERYNYFNSTRRCTDFL